MLSHTSLDANSFVFKGLTEIVQSAAAWQKIVERIFCINPHLNGTTFLLDL
jgi:hypothetical protein